MTLYIDVIWLLNFLFDCLILLLTAIILKRKFLPWRLLLGGFIGSLIILLSFTQFNTFSNNPFAKFLFSICIIIVTFGYVRFRTFLQALTTFYFVTFLLGGSLIGVHYYLTFDLNNYSAVMLTTMNSFGDPISWLFVLIGFPLSWHFAKTKLNDFEITKITYDELVDVTFVIDGDEFNFTGLIDSGNSLYDPLSRSPVMVVSLHDKTEDVPKSILQLAENSSCLETVMSNSPFKIRLIPCQVVGSTEGLLLAIKLDEIIINSKKEKTVYRDGLVSFTLQQLSVENKYDCLVHPKMVIN